MADPPPVSPAPDDATPVEIPYHPNVPQRRSVMLAFTGVMVAGILGGTIGWGLVRASCSDTPMQVQRLLSSLPGYQVHTRSCDWYLLLGALVGALICAIGAAIVAVLALRAQSEWKAHPARPGQRAEGGQPFSRTRGGGNPPRR
jgi:hypothetical protein